MAIILCLSATLHFKYSVVIEYHLVLAVYWKILIWMDILGEFLKNGNFKLVGQECNEQFRSVLLILKFASV